MAKLEMKGSFPLTKDSINKEITKESAGNYAFGYVKDKTFYIKYVGRSDTNLNDRIKHGIGNYKNFKFSYALSPKNAFEKECQNYHDFGEDKKLDNDIHPDRPDNSNWECPICDIFD